MSIKKLKLDKITILNHSLEGFISEIYFVVGGWRPLSGPNFVQVCGHIPACVLKGVTRRQGWDVILLKYITFRLEIASK